MKLHGNAALSLKKRRLLCRRVVDDEPSLTEAAAAAEVSERTARCRVRAGSGMRARRVCSIARRPRTVFKNRTPETRIEVIAALRRGVRFTGAQIAELLRMPETKCRAPCAGSGSVAAVG